jgi:hypothetical protein
VKRLFTTLIILSMAFTMAWAQNDLNLTFEDNTDLANWSHHDEANVWTVESWDATAGVDGSGALVFTDAGFTFLVKRPVTATLGTAYTVSIAIKNPQWETGNLLNLMVQGLSTDEPNVDVAGGSSEFVTYTLSGVADLATAGYIRLFTLGSSAAPTVTIDNVVFDDDAPVIPSVFFSEYLEGSSNNKALEIYNGTGEDLDISDFAIFRLNNGATTGADTTYMTGTVTAGDVFVIGNSAAIQAILDESDMLSTATYYNGDDYVALVYDANADGMFDLATETIDAIGVLGEDPGSAWDVAGVALATNEQTLIRKAEITMGNTDWASSAGTDAENSEWIVMPQDFVGSLGSHPYAPMGQVTFSVNMSFQITLGNFVVGTDFLDVAGTLNEWGGGDVLTDDDADGIYVGTFDVAPGVMEYKFRINGNWDTSESLAANRSYEVVEGENILPTVWYSDQEPVATTDVEVYIQVDMTVQLLNGNFDPSNGDLIVIRGSHANYGNWGGAIAMALDPEQTNIYTHLSSFDNVPVGSGYEYKFVILTGGDENAAIWEGSPNRTWIATGEEEDSDENGYGEIFQPVAYFADVTPDDIITQDVTVTWNVDITSAYRALAAGDTLIDTQTGSDDITAWDQINGICINGVLSQWWDWGNDVTCVGDWAMTQTDADGYMYSFSYLYTAGQAKSQQYKYGINSLDNEAGFAQNREFTIDDTNPTYVMDTDCFGEQNTDANLPLPQVCGPVSVASLPGIPTSYALSQNYPNPFNPTTTIGFAIPEASSVTLTIYNALGQEIRTLKTDYLNAGNYSVNWDGLDNAGNMIPSGLYIYTMTAGNQNFSKKMLMLK